MIGSATKERRYRDFLSNTNNHHRVNASSCLQTCSKRVCLDCGLEAHRDAVGVVNMAARCGRYAVGPMAWPMLLRWDRHKWNRSNGMPGLERSRVEA